MARPKTYTEDRVTTAVRLPETIHQELQQAAADRDLSVNYLVTRAVAEFLGKLIPADELRLTRDAEVKSR
jgi:predicted HicB family RNase H-like nuclease